MGSSQAVISRISRRALLFCFYAPLPRQPRRHKQHSRRHKQQRSFHKIPAPRHICPTRTNNRAHSRRASQTGDAAHAKHRAHPRAHPTNIAARLAGNQAARRAREYPLRGSVSDPERGREGVCAALLRTPI